MEKKSAISERIQRLITEFCEGKNLQFAKAIGVNESNIRSYLTGTQPRFDILAAIAEKFAVNCEWLLTGKGEMVKTKCTTDRLKCSTPLSTKDEVTNIPSHKQEKNIGIEDKLLAIIADKDATIRELAEEIGGLKQRIVQLEREKLDSVSGASDSPIANAG